MIKGGVFCLSSHPHPDLYFVRARIHDKREDYFETIDDFSYNKNIKHIKRGRINFPGQPMFYAGRNRITALAEVNIIQNRKEEEIVAYGISRWIIKKPMKLIAIINPDTIDQLKCSELSEFLDYVKTTYSKLQGTPNEGIIRIYKFLAEKFTERIIEGEEHKYLITSTLINQIFKKLSNVAGVLYQSVKRPSLYNIAIKPDYVDQGFIAPTHFFKQTFVRKNIIDLDEICLEEANSFDIGRNTVRWDEL